MLQLKNYRYFFHWRDVRTNVPLSLYLSLNNDLRSFTKRSGTFGPVGGFGGETFGTGTVRGDVL